MSKNVYALEKCTVVSKVYRTARRGHLGARDVELLDELAAVRVHARLCGPELVLDARLPRARLGNPAERYAGSKKWRMHSTYCT